MTELEYVRVLIRDPSSGTGNPAGTGSPRFSDTEITGFLDLYSAESSGDRIFLAAADLCDATGAGFATTGTVSGSSGGATVRVEGEFEITPPNVSTMQSSWASLAKSYRDRATGRPDVSVIEWAGDLGLQDAEVLARDYMREWSE